MLFQALTNRVCRRMAIMSMCIVLLSGCFSIPDLSFLPETNLSPAEVEIKAPKDNIEKYELSQINKSLQEWKQLQPSLIRLSKMEGELAYLLEKIEANVMVGPVYVGDDLTVDIGYASFTDQVKPALGDQSYANSEGSNKSTPDMLKVAEAAENSRMLVDATLVSEASELTPAELVNIDSKAVAEFIEDKPTATKVESAVLPKFDEVDKPMSVELGTADPIIEADEILAKQTYLSGVTLKGNTLATFQNTNQVNANSSNSKFSNTPARQLEATSVESKFSKSPSRLGNVNLKDNLMMQSNEPPANLKNQRPLDTARLINAECGEIEGSFAIHLVSYSSMTQIPDGWRQLSPKINRLTCNRGAVVKQVEVKGKTFYSLRVGPYLTRDQVQNVCAEISKKGMYCAISTYEGAQI